MDQVIQIGGSLLILVPFVLAQCGRVRTSSVAYIVLNLVGSTVLSIDAAFGHQWGFLLLESVWAAVSLGSLVRVLHPRTDQTRVSDQVSSDLGHSPSGESRAHPR